MLLQLKHIHKSYGTTAVLTDISMQIQERERIGLVGVNGAGKSTLLKIIAGELSADSGDIIMPKDIRIGYMAQQSGLQSDRSIYEEMRGVFAHLFAMEQELRALETAMADPDTSSDPARLEDVMRRYDALSERFRSLGGYEAEARIRIVLHGMGFGDFPPDTRIPTLSGGQKTRLALAKLLLQEPDLLLLDEPTNYLDIPTLTWLEGYLKGYSGALLIVSHDRYFLDATVTAIYEIERTEAKRYTGNYSRFIEIKETEADIYRKHYEKQQEEIAKLEEFIRRNIARASTTRRAQSRRKQLERMQRLDRPPGELRRAAFAFEIDRTSGNDVLEVSGLTASVGDASNESGRRRLWEGLSFRLTRGEMVALIGPNGIGKSTLLKTLVGQHRPDAGTIRWGSNVKLAYYDQEQTGLNPANTVLEEVWSAFPHLEEARIRTVLGQFLFSGEDVLKRISSLSGGEKARVSLAKLMLLRANVLILDEPTNHLDVYSKEVLEDALLDYEGTVLFISHDRYFLNKLADRVVELDNGGITVYLGNYDDYVEKKKELEFMAAENRRQSGDDPAGAHAEPPAGGSPAKAASSYDAAKQNKRQERSRLRRIEQLEAEISSLEAEQTELQEQLAQPEVYGNYLLVQEKQAALMLLQEKLAERYAEWEQLMEET
ncbi:ABC-F family ATP-binding cassette domain-containing protein [Paenibacillus thermoaerophilus]|uniref:ABC-F family ATP-binding cassette domain-containing protein n=1 Tax=Paenibacillus thermoaerophilus TaxID=1215385 RepID=A0ABW2V316_9BACL|nr:ABC-F family ATP-binding cassette domain-containing protein [Paenibacillus thermoaerophilus]TMV11051.1 ABC-F family ATP-binding cassette domain-containing protein [Paenibacillus thermoaerophilus]